MIIGDRLRAFREERNLSQGDIEKRTGLLRVYLSRVENGHTIPSIETLEKLARAFEVPLYKLFYDGDEPPKSEHFPKRISTEDLLWGTRGKEAKVLKSFQKTLQVLRESDRDLLLFIARKLASKRGKGVAAA
jgi:transcriptional regulator with XRE-family HTH domain